MDAPPCNPHTIELHLRIHIVRGQRDAFLAFLREAIPFYQRPGGIRIRLLQNTTDDHRFIEIVEYQSQADHDADQHRIASDPEMKTYLDRWHTLLAAPPEVEFHRTII